MCGIIAIIRRPAQRETPSATRVRSLIEAIPETRPNDLQDIYLLIDSLALLESEPLEFREPWHSFRAQNYFLN